MVHRGWNWYPRPAKPRPSRARPAWRRCRWWAKDSWKLMAGFEDGITFLASATRTKLPLRPGTALGTSNAFGATITWPSSRHLVQLDYIRDRSSERVTLLYRPKPMFRGGWFSNRPAPD